ncbi:hypothetical protein NEOLEDRAFT_1073598, partial [Neolentinus lepideus HHB14362 ss-1]
LTSTVDDHHRTRRKMLNPIPSASHLRLVVPTFYRITKQVYIIGSCSRIPRDNIALASRYMML